MISSFAFPSKYHPMVIIQTTTTMKSSLCYFNDIHSFQPAMINCVMPSIRANTMLFVITYNSHNEEHYDIYHSLVPSYLLSNKLHLLSSMSNAICRALNKSCREANRTPYLASEGQDSNLNHPCVSFLSTDGGVLNNDWKKPNLFDLVFFFGSINHNAGCFIKH